MRYDVIANRIFQQTEVSDMKWFSIKSCLEKIRPYNLEKKEIIKNIDLIINKYKFIV